MKKRKLIIAVALVVSMLSTGFVSAEETFTPPTMETNKNAN